MSYQPARNPRNPGAKVPPAEGIWKRITGRWEGLSPVLLLLGLGVALVLLAKLAMIAMLAPVSG